MWQPQTPVKAALPFRGYHRCEEQAVKAVEGEKMSRVKSAGEKKGEGRESRGGTGKDDGFSSF